MFRSTSFMAVVVLASACVVSGASLQQERSFYAPPAAVGTTPIPIVARSQEANLDGSYQYSYQTGNGIAAGESGYLKDAGTQNEGPVAQGFYTYTGPDGVVYQLEYYSDAETGFVAKGAHLPTAPPLPEELVRANELAYKNAAADAGQYDERGFPLNTAKRY